MGISPELQEILSSANERYAAERFVILGIFGSRARGDNKPHRDALRPLAQRFILPETVYVA